MSDRKIQKLCDPKKSKGFWLPPYWTAEVYGFGKWIRQYSHFPKFLPLCIYTDHGPMTLGVLEQELKSRAPYQFYHSSELVKRWKKMTTTPAEVLYSPFVFCRKSLGISKSSEAIGTIAFPAHSTVNIDDMEDMEVYAKQLLDLPKKFQPVAVCIYYNDIVKNVHEVFRKYKIPVYTAGYYFDYRFTERFYDILRRFKYATSNVAGSYLFYAVEMGIPFFIYGQKQRLINNSDPNLAIGTYDPYKLSSDFRKTSKMFGHLSTEITPQQKDFVESSLGLRAGVKPTEMRKILYIAFYKWLFSFRPFILVAKLLRKLVGEHLIQKQKV